MPTEKDSLKRIKHIAYCMSQMPPESEAADFSDLITFAKYQLCMEKRVLFFDSIWDKYTDEQILIEYYALTFSRSEEARHDFEAGLDSTNDFLDQQIQKNQADLAKRAEEDRESTAELEESDEDGFTFEPGKI